MNTKIITNEAALRLPCRLVSVTEGLRIGRKLLAFMQAYNKNRSLKAVGLAANQIGILSQVCIVKKNGVAIILVNPKVVAYAPEQVSYSEACLSFPGKTFKTFRRPWLVIRSDNLGEIRFGVDSFADGTYNDLLFEAVIAAHEIDHCFGITPKEREDKNFFNEALGL